MPLSTIKSKAGFTQSVYNQVVASAQSLQIASGVPTTCDSGGKANVTPTIVLSTAGSLAVKLAPLAGPAAPVVALAGAAAGLFGAIFGAHAAKVKQEQQIECAAIPAADQGLTAIYQAVQNGTMTPQAGIDALGQLQQEFRQTVAPILKMNSSQCNAVCVETKELAAACAQMASQFQDLISQQSAAPAGTSSTSSGGSASPIGAGLPGWLLPAAAFFLLYEIT